MRKKFIETLVKLAEEDKDIFLLTGDLGFSVFESFAQKFPNRFINCGVSEQNMMGMAAGLALEGKKPYVYSIIPFATMRCYEQIRNDICYPNLNVKIIGMGAGFSYGSQDFTHYAIEDISILRPLPNIMILSPADSFETEKLFLQSYVKKQPVYIRLDKSGGIIHQNKIKINIGKPFVAKKGKKIVIITTGTSLKTAFSVVDKAKKDKLDFKILHLHTIKPVDEKSFIKEITGFKKIITIEEHSTVGGLASLVNDILAKHKINNIFIKNLGVSDNFKNVVGNQEFLKKYHNIDENSLYKSILSD